MRAAGCAALGMLGGGFWPPPPPPDAQTGQVNLKPRWAFDKDVAAAQARAAQHPGTQGPAAAAAPRLNGGSPSERALAAACPDLAARLLDLARMDPDPEVTP